jgi:hypothetical protein
LKAGHFRFVADALDRASLPRAQRVGDLARLLWPESRFPLTGTDPPHPPLTLRLDHTAPRGSLRAILHVPAETWAIELPPVGTLATEDFDRYRAHVREQLQNYPTLNDAQLYEPAPTQFHLSVVDLDTRGVMLQWPKLDNPYEIPTLRHSTPSATKPVIPSLSTPKERAARRRLTRFCYGGRFSLPWHSTCATSP